MGRSVETRSDALITAYADWEGDFDEWYQDWPVDQEDEDDGPIDLLEIAERVWEDVRSNYWQGSKEWFVDYAQELFPSLEAAYRGVPYPYRESEIVLENQLVEISVAEYAGMTAICVSPKYDDYGTPTNPALAATWVRQIEDKFMRAFNNYNLLGTASNGSSFYERVRTR